jgi:hypothetical protein
MDFDVDQQILKNARAKNSGLRARLNVGHSKYGYGADVDPQMKLHAIFVQGMSHDDLESGEPEIFDQVEQANHVVTISRL